MVVSLRQKSFLDDSDFSFGLLVGEKSLQRGARVYPVGDGQGLRWFYRLYPLFWLGRRGAFNAFASAADIFFRFSGDCVASGGGGNLWDVLGDTDFNGEFFGVQFVDFLVIATSRCAIARADIAFAASEKMSPNVARARCRDGGVCALFIPVFEQLYRALLGGADRYFPAALHGDYDFRHVADDAGERLFGRSAGSG